MADKKSSSGGVGLGLDFSLNPCSPLLALFLLPPLTVFIWFLVK
jgi:hypothetical protein